MTYEQTTRSPGILEQDIASLLKAFGKANWRNDVLHVGEQHSREVNLTANSTTRLEDSDEALPYSVVDGLTLRHKLPWLFELYTTVFLQQAKTVAAPNEIVVAGADTRTAIVMNFLEAGQRYEVHTDTNPITGVLFITSHYPGGELVVSIDPNTSGVRGIETKSRLVIQPKAGNLVIFDGTNPHYVRPLHHGDPGPRASIVMNYYTSSLPESARPIGLTTHMFG